MEHLFNRLLNLDDRRRRFPATLDELAYQVTDTRSKKVINALGVGFKIRNRCLQFTDFFLHHGDSVSIRGTFWQLKLRGLAREVRVCVLVLGLRYVLHKYTRSEEHTSELQSRGHLVCRLLLEKKKDFYRHATHTMVRTSKGNDERAAKD